MSLMIAQVFLQAAILCGLLHLIARHEADYSFSKVAMVVAGLTLGGIVIDATFKASLGLWVAFVHLTFIAFMIMTFCWISWWKSLVVVVVYSTVHFALALLSMMVMASVMKGSLASPAGAPMGSSPQEIKDIQAEIVHNAEMAAEQNSPDVAPAEAADAPDVKPASTPAETAPAPGADDWTTARRSLQVGARASGSGVRLVYINGQHREVGDVISTSFGGMVYRWRLKAIDDGGVQLTPLDKRPATATPAAP